MEVHSGGEQWRCPMEGHNWGFKVEVYSGCAQLRCIVEVHSGSVQWRFIMEVHSGGAQLSCPVELHNLGE